MKTSIIFFVSILIHALVILVNKRSFNKKDQSYKIISIVFLSCLVMSSCEPNLYFDEPMPPGILKLKSIPEDLTGVFNWELDGTFFILDDRGIYTETWYVSKANLNDIAQTESCEINEENIYHSQLEECIAFSYIDEFNIMSYFIETDTSLTFLKIKTLNFTKETFI